MSCNENVFRNVWRNSKHNVCTTTSVEDPDPTPDPSLFPKMCWADWNNEKFKNILTQNFNKKINLIFRLKMIYLWASFENKMWKKYFFFSILKINEERSRFRSWIRISMKKGVGSGVGSGSGSISQRYGSGDPDPNPDPHQNVTDPQHWYVHMLIRWCLGVGTDLANEKHKFCHYSWHYILAFYKYLKNIVISILLPLDCHSLYSR